MTIETAAILRGRLCQVYVNAHVELLGVLGECLEERWADCVACVGSQGHEDPVFDQLLVLIEPRGELERGLPVVAPWAREVLQCWRNHTRETSFRERLGNRVTVVVVVPDAGDPAQEAFVRTQASKRQDVVARQGALDPKEQVFDDVALERRVEVEGPQEVECEMRVRVDERRGDQLIAEVDRASFLCGAAIGIVRSLVAELADSLDLGAGDDELSGADSELLCFSQEDSPRAEDGVVRGHVAELLGRRSGTTRR